MASFYIPNDLHGFSVYFSPFNPKQLAVVASERYGLHGGGCLFILNLDRDLRVERIYQWPYGLFDVIWSEIEPLHVVTASGDGTLQLWNLNQELEPLSVFHGHKSDVYSIDWSKTRREQCFLSGSWDKSIKIWDPNRINFIEEFSVQSTVNSATFSPQIPYCFASVCSDGYFNLCNYKSKESITSFRVHDAEALSCDWCKYDQNLLLTTGTNGLIRIWDIRNYNNPITQLKTNDYPIRKAKFSPTDLSTLATVGYDFTTRIWNFKNNVKPLETLQHHSEFVYGLDWNTLERGQLADCSWDSKVKVFTPNCLVNS